MAEKRDINQVRQVLMNELGLTRESIREMARELVVAEVGKELRHIQETGVIQETVAKTMEAWARRNAGRFIDQRLQEQLTEHIREKFVISAMVEIRGNK